MNKQPSHRSLSIFPFGWQVSDMLGLPHLSKAEELERRADEVFQAIFSSDLSTEISEDEFLKLMMRALEGIGETLRGEA